jgi:hypothetical protein
MGILEDPERPTDEVRRSDMLLDLGKHRKVEAFEMIGPRPTLKIQPTSMPPEDVFKFQAPLSRERGQPTSENVPAAWPYDPEILYHLDWVPYLDLGIAFDPAPMLQEALRALGYFVTHRDYDQTNSTSHGQWKALGLRALFGDWEKTQYHTSYSFEGAAIYKETVFAELCPETMRFLKTLTDLQMCERVRFMLLEPGACVKTHRDSDSRDVSLAVNISLNMPEGCVFWTDLNKDGSLNSYSQRVPFRDQGSVVLFNNAKYHRVENLSTVPRIHIIFHGPIRRTDSQLLDRARRQNGIGSRKELLKRLVRKKAFLGESFEKTSMLTKDWVTSGLDADMFGAEIRLLIWAHAGTSRQPQLQDALEKVTKASAFPLEFETANEDQIDSHLTAMADKGTQVAVLVAAGTLLADLNPLILAVMDQIRAMRAAGALACGHIMDFPEAGKIPYFHEQFLMLDLDLWSALGRPPLGPLFSNRDETFPPCQRGADIHDNYTPSVLSPGDRSPSRQGKAHWGTQLMATALQSGHSILNLSEGPNSMNIHGITIPRRETK